MRIGKLLKIGLISAMLTVSFDAVSMARDPLLDAMAEEPINAERLRDGKFEFKDHDVGSQITILEKELNLLQADSNDIATALEKSENVEDLAAIEAQFHADLEQFKILKDELIASLESDKKANEELVLLLEMREEFEELKSKQTTESGIDFLSPGTFGITALGFAAIGILQIFAKELIGKNLGGFVVRILAKSAEK